MSVTVALKNVFQGTGEGPFWDGEKRCLYVVDLADPIHPNGRLFRWDTHTLEERNFEKQSPTCIIPTEKEDEILLTLDQRLGLYNFKTSTFSQLAEVDAGKKTRFNDGKCDSKGRFWAGTMSLEKAPAVVYEEGSGSLFSFTSERGIRTHDKDFTISNGFAWTKDDKRMFFIDSVPRHVYSYDYDANSGEISKRKVLKDFSQLPIEEYGYPDGCCIDTEDRLWVALYAAGKVVCLDVDTGEILREVKIPAKRTTSVCFAGENLDEMYVTSGRYGTTDEEFAEVEHLAGSLFKITGLNAKGVPPNKFTA